MINIDRIPGAEKLVAAFGEWPTFEDAEVLWLHLNRNGCSVDLHPYDGPTLEAMIHTFEMTDEIDENRRMILRNHMLVYIRFCHVVNLRIEGFNPQNALHGLLIPVLIQIDAAAASQAAIP